MTQIKERYLNINLNGKDEDGGRDFLDDRVHKSSAGTFYGAEINNKRCLYFISTHDCE